MSLRNGIYRGTEGATNIGTKFFLAADLVRGGKVTVAYVPTAGWLHQGSANPAHQKFCRAIGLAGFEFMIRSDGTELVQLYSQASFAPKG